MAENAIVDDAVFPKVGARARHWLRFERDLLAWLDSADGRFAIWSAEQQLASGLASSSPSAPAER